MSGYFPSSNAEGEGMQTLYLMNPSYTGFHESSNSGSVTLISQSGGPTCQDPRFDNLGHEQQHHGGFSLSSPVAPSAVYQNTHMGSYQNSSSMFANSANGHGYGWNGGNTFALLCPAEMAEESGSMTARLGVMTAVHQSATNDMFHFGVRSFSQPTIHQQDALILNGVPLDVESLQASGNVGQILSLSLSPQLQSIPQAGGVNDCLGFSIISSDDNLGRGESIRMSDGDLGSFQETSQDNTLHPGLQTVLINNRQINMIPNTYTMQIYKSKYLKAAQQLLDEVVSVEINSKSNSINNTQVISWTDPNEGLPDKDHSLTGSFGKNLAAGGWNSSKEKCPSLSSAPDNDSAIPEQSTGSMVELTLAERHDLQMKKTKLMTVLEEVDQRYRQYYHQMQVVVGSFEFTAGLGAAHTYTTLALQTISKHFRCLKDAIRTQIHSTCRLLGEEDALSSKKGETSRLHFIDQQLRQQHAFQQLGMIQQRAWRPQRGLPEHSVTILRAWLFEHFLHPYPKDSDKLMLARQTGLTRNQVSNWFINARVRLWKPMIEEMYAEEIKEGKDEASQGTEGEVNMRGMNSFIEGEDSESTSIMRSPNLRDGNIVHYSDPKAMLENVSSMFQSKRLEGELSDSLLQERGGIGHMVKRAKHVSPSSVTLLNTHSGAHMGYKPGQPVHDMRIQGDERYINDFSMTHGDIGHVNYQNMRGYSSIPLMELMKYSNEGPPSGNAAVGGVSLTLGLQHTDGLSLAGAQSSIVHGPPYMQGILEQQMFRRKEDGMAPVIYYGMNENMGCPDGEYRAMESKRYENHLHHDFA